MQILLKHESRRPWSWLISDVRRMTFTATDAAILFAISSGVDGCPIPEIYWRVDFFNRIVPSAGEISAAVEKGLKAGLVGYSNERLIISNATREKLGQYARDEPWDVAQRAMVDWLNEEFKTEARPFMFQLTEYPDDSFRYGIGSVEWHVLCDGSEVSEVPIIK